MTPRAALCVRRPPGLEPSAVPCWKMPASKGASIFVYLIFCLLIAIFVINFGPQGGGSGSGGCTRHEQHRRLASTVRR